MANYAKTGSFSRLNTDPLRNFRFLVEIHHGVSPERGPNGKLDAGQGLLQMGFTAVDGLSATTNSIPYRQGGYNTTVQQIPGQTTFSPVTFQRGQLFGTRADWDWMRQLFAANVGTGARLDPVGGFRGYVDIWALQHPNTTIGDLTRVPKQMGWRLYNAWPTAISYSTLNAGDNSFIVASMTLVHEGFEVVVATATGDEASALTAKVGPTNFPA